MSFIQTNLVHWICLYSWWWNLTLSQLSGVWLLAFASKTKFHFHSLVVLVACQSSQYTLSLAEHMSFTLFINHFPGAVIFYCSFFMLLGYTASCMYFLFFLFFQVRLPLLSMDSHSFLLQVLLSSLHKCAGIGDASCIRFLTRLAALANDPHPTSISFRDAMRHQQWAWYLLTAGWGSLDKIQWVWEASWN